MKKFSLFFFFTTLLTSLNLQAAQNSQPIVLTQLEGRAWVEKAISQYPEILWLADANVRKTEEGDAKILGTAYSETLIRQKICRIRPHPHDLALSQAHPRWQ